MNFHDEILAHILDHLVEAYQGILFLVYAFRATVESSKYQGSGSILYCPFPCKQDYHHFNKIFFYYSQTSCTWYKIISFTVCSNKTIPCIPFASKKKILMKVLLLVFVKGREKMDPRSARIVFYSLTTSIQYIFSNSDKYIPPSTAKFTRINQMISILSLSLHHHHHLPREFSC